MQAGSGVSSINTAALALQGGATHAAFTWGVVDQLLADGLRPAALSGVSSGALLGVALAQGWARGGAQGARAEMKRLWARLAYCPLPLLGSIGESLSCADHSGLRSVVEDLLDLSALRSSGSLPLTVSATNVMDGSVVSFDNHSLTKDALLASCCLPLLYAPVEISGQILWDGRFSGNPPLAPLLTPRLPDTLIVVRAQPCRRAPLMHSPVEMINRMQELFFENLLKAEIRALPASVDVLMYEDDILQGDFSASVQGNLDPVFVETLFKAGQRAAFAPARRARPMSSGAASTVTAEGSAEISQLKAQVVALQEQARATKKAQAVVASQLRHDIRGALSAAMLVAEMMSMSKEADRKRAGDVVMSAITRVNDLIRKPQDDLPLS